MAKSIIKNISSSIPRKKKVKLYYVKITNANIKKPHFLLTKYDLKGYIGSQKVILKFKNRRSLRYIFCLTPNLL